MDPVTPKSREAPPRLQKDDRNSSLLPGGGASSPRKPASWGSVLLKTRLDPGKQRAHCSLFDQQVPGDGWQRVPAGSVPRASKCGEQGS